LQRFEERCREKCGSEARIWWKKNGDVY